MPLRMRPRAPTASGPKVSGLGTVALTCMRERISKVKNVSGTHERTFLMGPNMGKTVYDNAWQDGRIECWGAFGEYRTSVGIWDLVGSGRVGSGRVELNSATAEDPSDEFTQVAPIERTVQVNPNVSLGAGVPVAKHWRLSLWRGRAQRGGSITERYINFFPVGQDPYEMLGNPDLEAEVNHQFDLQVKYRRERTSLEFDAFASVIGNYITSRIDTSLTPRMPTSPGVRQYINLEQALLTGFEASWNQRFGDHFAHRLAVAYTYGQDLERNEALPEIAPIDLRYTAMAYFVKNRLGPEATVRFVGAQNRISREFGENVSPEFTAVDLNVHYELIDGLSVSVGVLNVFDVAYFEHLNRSVRAPGAPPLYAPGRNITFTATWRIGA